MSMISGTTVRINDVSPTPHEMKVNVRSDVISDLSSITLTAQGKNLIDVNAFQIGKYTVGGGVGAPIDIVNREYCAISQPFKVLPNTEYTLSVDNSAYRLYRMCEMDSNDLCTANWAWYYSGEDYSKLTFKT